MQLFIELPQSLRKATRRWKVEALVVLIMITEVIIVAVLPDDVDHDVGDGSSSGDTVVMEKTCWW